MDGKLLVVTALNHHVLDANIIYAELGDSFKFVMQISLSVGDE